MNLLVPITTMLLVMGVFVYVWSDLMGGVRVNVSVNCSIRDGEKSCAQLGSRARRTGNNIVISAQVTRRCLRPKQSPG